MKFGQAMSIFEAALPDEIAKPYRETLRKLQDAAPPMPPSVVHRVMTEEFGPYVARAVPDLRGRACRGRVHRPGAPRDVAGVGGSRAGRRRREAAVPGCRQGAALRPAPAGTAGSRVCADRTGRRCRGHHRRAPDPRRRGARLSPGGGEPERSSPTPTPTIPTSSFRAPSPAPTTRSSPPGWTRPDRWPTSSPTAPRTSATTSAASTSISSSPARLGSDCSMPTRTRATTASSSPANSASSTSAQSTGFPTASRQSWVAWSGSP